MPVRRAVSGAWQMPNVGLCVPRTASGSHPQVLQEGNVIVGWESSPPSPCLLECIRKQYSVRNSPLVSVKNTSEEKNPLAPAPREGAAVCGAAALPARCPRPALLTCSCPANCAPTGLHSRSASPCRGCNGSRVESDDGSGGLNQTR